MNKRRPILSAAPPPWACELCSPTSTPIRAMQARCTSTTPQPGQTACISSADKIARLTRADCCELCAEGCTSPLTHCRGLRKALYPHPSQSNCRLKVMVLLSLLTCRHIWSGALKSPVTWIKSASWNTGKWIQHWQKVNCLKKNSENRTPGHMSSRAAVSTVSSVRLDNTNWSCRTTENCQFHLWKGCLRLWDYIFLIPN